jgi:hypothetical protein
MPPSYIGADGLEMLEILGGYRSCVAQKNCGNSKLF